MGFSLGKGDLQSLGKEGAAAVDRESECLEQRCVICVETVDSWTSWTYSSAKAETMSVPDHSHLPLPEVPVRLQHTEGS